MSTTVDATANSVPIDVREIVAWDRHGLIFDRLAALPEGGSVQLLNNHDLIALRQQMDRQWPGQFRCTTLDIGPDLWRLEIHRLERSRTSPGSSASGNCCSGGACCG